MIESLSTTSPQVCRALVLHLCPKLAEAIATPTTDETVHIPAEAIQLANALLRGRGSDIEPELVGSVTAAVLDVLDRTDDMDSIQVSWCAKCTRAPKLTAAWRYPSDIYRPERRAQVDLVVSPSVASCRICSRQA